MGAAVLLLTALLVSGAASLDSGAAAVATEFFSLRGVRQVVLFACSSDDARRLSKALHGRGRFWVFVAGRRHDEAALRDLARQTYHSQGVFVDHTCERGRRVLRLNSERRYLNASHRWLVWGGAPRVSDPLLSSLNLSADSDVTWAAGRALLDLHKVHYTGPPLVEAARSAAQPRRRRDLRGLQLRAGLVVNNIPVENLEQELEKPENRNKDAMATFNYAIYKFLMQQFNFSVRLLRTHWFGYVVENGRYEGLVKMIGDGEVEVHVSSMGLNQARLRHMDVTAHGPLFREMLQQCSRDNLSRICSIFRHPTVVGGLDAMLTPFSRGLWFCAAAACGAVVLALRFVSWTHSWLGAAPRGEPNTSWSDAFMAIMGTVGQQGIVLDSKWLSWRIVFLVMLMVTLLIDTYYAASIVFSLITEPPKTIRTAKDLINSDLEFAVENLSYNIPFFQMNDDPLVHELYVKKMLGQHRTQPVYYNRQEGIRKVLHEKFAFHSEPSNVYPIIEATFPDSKKCSLTEIQIIPTEICYMPIRWNSPYKEIITYGLRKVAETGLLHRLNAIWRPPKPRCFSAGGDFVTVGLSTVAPAFAVLVSGAAAACVVLAVERCCSRTRARL